jgi:hypothetical protein
MVMASQEGRYYADIEEIELTFSPQEANERLARGYELLKIETISAEQSPPEARKLVFVLGRRKKDRIEYDDRDRRTDVTIPASIPWTQKNESFAWAFATNKDGSPIEEYKGFVERLKLSPIEKDGYRYSISRDGRFLQRSKVESKK